MASPSLEPAEDSSDSGDDDDDDAFDSKYDDVMTTSHFLTLCHS